MRVFKTDEYNLTGKIIKPTYLRAIGQPLLFYKNKLYGWYVDDIIQSFSQISKVKANAKFNILEYFIFDEEAMKQCKDRDDVAKYAREGKSVYVVIKNQLGTFLCRGDNLIVTEDINKVFYNNRIIKLIKSGDATILIDDDNDRYIVKKNAEDEEDLEKAVAFLLLKRAGYNLEDVYAMVDYLNK